MAPRTPPCLAQRPPPHAHFRQRVFSGAPARLRPPCGHKWCWDWPVPSRARTCVLSPGTCGPGAPRPARPPSPPAAAEAGLPGRREEALAWLLEKPRICSKCKQQVILSLPPSPGGVDTFDIGGDGVGSPTGWLPSRTHCCCQEIKAGELQWSRRSPGRTRLDFRWADACGRCGASGSQGKWGDSRCRGSGTGWLLQSSADALGKHNTVYGETVRPLGLQLPGLSDTSGQDPKVNTGGSALTRSRP